MDVLMPQLGETVAEGKISTWFRSVGDRVSAGDNLFEVETDKTAMEVPTTFAGVIAEIRVPAGATVPVGTVVAIIADHAGAAGPPPSAKTSIAPIRRAEQVPAPRASAPPPPPIAASQSPSIPRAGRPYDPFREVHTPERNYGPARLPSGIPITPLARRLAAEAGIDLREVKGSGPSGRIVASDVEDSIASARSASALNGELAGLFDPASFEIVPHDAGRRRQATQVAAAKHSVPHFYLRRDVAVDTLLALIEEINAVDASFQITLRDCVVKALAVALTQIADANVRWTDDHMLRFHQVDIAVAMNAGHTKVIHAADRKSVGALARECATAGAEPNGAGSHGVSAVWDMSATAAGASAAIVLPPHVSALTIGAIGQHAVVREGAIAIENRSMLTLSCDHRAIDGVVGARLISACAALLERPMALVL
jgi:pyruvate dehydrogenase E2 component (dihydrolipoamide acetyltransferase)